MLDGSELVVVAVAGVLAGGVNAVAGGGSLLTFPVLVAAGLPALEANITNTIAQLPGYASVAHGYRRELHGQRGRLRALAPPAILGGLLGVAALKLTSEGAFEVIAPVLVLCASVLLAVQPRLSRAIAMRERAAGERLPPALLAGVFGCGVYAAYFGAAAGVVLLAVLALGLDDALQRLNALNRTLVLVANLVAVPLFAVLGPVNWTAVAVLAPSTLVGGALGARVARRLSERVLRALVVALGIAIGLWLLVR